MSLFFFFCFLPFFTGGELLGPRERKRERRSDYREAEEKMELSTRRRPRLRTVPSLSADKDERRRRARATLERMSWPYAAH